jgi:hypothetical protein
MSNNHKKAEKYWLFCCFYGLYGVRVATLSAAQKYFSSLLESKILQKYDYGSTNDDVM